MRSAWEMSRCVVNARKAFCMYTMKANSFISSSSPLTIRAFKSRKSTVWAPPCGRLLYDYWYEVCFEPVYFLPTSLLSCSKSESASDDDDEKKRCADMLPKVVRCLLWPLLAGLIVLNWAMRRPEIRCICVANVYGLLKFSVGSIAALLRFAYRSIKLESIRVCRVNLFLIALLASVVDKFYSIRFEILKSN